MASSSVPKNDQKSEAQSKGCAICPTTGSSETCTDSAASTGRKAKSVITASTTDTPRSSMIEAKRMVSSCTRCAAPSIPRTSSQRLM